jgi:rhodanese-related sulfurtransferase
MDPAVIAIIGFFIVLFIIKRASLSSKTEIFEALKRSYMIIDVRTPNEFASGNIKGSVNIPLGSIAGADDQLPKDKSETVFVYCLSGARSGSARSILLKKGYTHVLNLGGYTRAKSLVAQGLEGLSD